MKHSGFGAYGVKAAVPFGSVALQRKDSKAVKTAMKKMLAGLLALALLASFTGCAWFGADETETTTAGETTTAAPGTFPTTQAETETTTAEETTAPVTLPAEETTISQVMLSVLVPMPDFGIRMTFSETENEWTGSYTGVRFVNYGDYISRLKKAGFNRNISSVKALNSYTFSADNGEGIEISIAYARLLGTMTVTAER